MITIRIPKSNWAKAWRAMVEIAPVHLIADDPVYEVLPAHLDLLTMRGFTYEVVPDSRNVYISLNNGTLHGRSLSPHLN